MANITKAEFDALPESLKTEFKADGDGYALIKEDVEGLKMSKTQILEEKKKLQAEFDAAKKKLDEIDASKSADEEEKLKAAGAFKELEDKLRAKITEVETASAAREQELLSNWHSERIENEFVKRGGLPDRAEYAVPKLLAQTEFAKGDDGYSLKTKNGIGDAKEFDALFDGLKTSSPFFFAASSASGSGASGSEGQGGGTPKTATKEQIKEMSPEAKREFYINGGEQTK